jgi:hypothetical protein
VNGGAALRAAGVCCIYAVKKVNLLVKYQQQVRKNQMMEENKPDVIPFYLHKQLLL